jgi:Skp family chaperone for outer membrane proteins
MQVKMSSAKINCASNKLFHAKQNPIGTKQNIMKKASLPMLFLCIISFHLHAQVPSVKIGYVDINYVFARMPVMKEIDTEMKSIQSQLNAQYELKLKELELNTANLKNRRKE